MQLFMYWYESELNRRDSNLLCMEPNSDYVPQKNVVKKKKKNFTSWKDRSAITALYLVA